MTNKPLNKAEACVRTADCEQSVHWTLNQVKGTEVLVIGKTALFDEEQISIQENISLRVAGISGDEVPEKEFDTIILAGTAEHIKDSVRILNIAHKHLKNEGCLIVTIPIGINTYMDHKYSNCYGELVQQLIGSFFIEKMESIGDYTGIVCRKMPGETLGGDRGELGLGYANDSNEYNLLNRITVMQQTIDSQEKEINELKQTYIEAVAKLNRKMDRLGGESCSQRGDQNDIQQLLQQIETLKSELRTSLINEEKLLRAQLAVPKRASIHGESAADLEKKLKQVERKYEALKQSRLGAITLKCWELKKKIKGRV
ncbi:MAG: hypothetical protein ACI4XL_09860 [Bacillus sp. (in: firmicutes)]